MLHKVSVNKSYDRTKNVSIFMRGTAQYNVLDSNRQLLPLVED